MPSLPVLTRKELKARFATNMRRVAGFAAAIYPESRTASPTASSLTSEGFVADLRRAMVVFLHASFEDFIRSQLPARGKRFTFSSRSDLSSALKRLGLEAMRFSDLAPPLTQLARRRNDIVHHADLQERDVAAAPWEFSDDWLFVHWNLAVVTFHHRLLAATGDSGLIEARALQNVESAFRKSIEVIKAMIALGSGSRAPDELLAGFKDLVAMMDSMRETLKLDVSMFLDADGKPRPGI